MKHQHDFFDANPAPLENRRGRHSGAYYPAMYAIWNDDTSIINGSPVQLIQRMDPERELDQDHPSLFPKAVKVQLKTVA